MSIRVYAGSRHFAWRKKKIIVVIKNYDWRTVQLHPSCSFCFRFLWLFPWSDNTHLELVTGINFDTKSIVSWLHLIAISNNGLINKGVNCFVLMKMWGKKASYITLRVVLTTLIKVIVLKRVLHIVLAAHLF